MLVTIARHAKTRGQTLVVVAFGLIVTLLFAGLAIDGSNAYHQRRRMQNAADSGALAGARALASGGNTNAQILQTVRYYASENGAPSASVTAWYVDNSQKISQIPDDGNAPPPELWVWMRMLRQPSPFSSAGSWEWARRAPPLKLSPKWARWDRWAAAAFLLGSKMTRWTN